LTKKYDHLDSYLKDKKRIESAKGLNSAEAEKNAAAANLTMAQ
jgi:hypothetical protein